MEIPKNVKTFEMQSSIIWFDSDGILFSVPKPGSQQVRSAEEIKNEMTKFRDITGGKKVCMILEANSNSRPPKKEERDLIAQELENAAKAMAIITTSPLSRMIANLFFGLKPPAYPVKMVKDEKEAKEWIKQYL